MRIPICSTWVAVLLTLALCACNSASDNISDPNAISDQERAAMVDFARYSLKVSKNILTEDDKAAIAKNGPEIKEYYTGYKTGRMAMAWELPGKKVTIAASGRLLSDTMHWELAVTKKDAAWITKSAAGAKSEKVEPKDFLHLIKKQ